MTPRINSLFDPSNELIISRYAYGIKLKKPTPHRQLKTSEISSNTAPTVSTVLQLPCNAYFLNTDSQFKNANEICALTCYGASIKSCLGKGALDIVPREIAKNTIRNDQLVMSSGKLIICEEELKFKNAISLTGLSIKLPWYSHENKIIGLLGLSILSAQQALAESLLQITQLGLLTPPLEKQIISERYEINNVRLSKRETDVMHLLIRGNTAKQAAKKLFLSPRTIEDHIENIKIKTNCTSKSELVEKATEQFFTSNTYNEVKNNSL